MKPRMKIKRALAVCARGPKTEAQRTQALAALRHFGTGIKHDYPHADAAQGLLEDIDTEYGQLAAADLRGRS